MDEQQVDSGKKNARRLLRGCAVSVSAVVVVLAIAGVILIPAFSRANMGGMVLTEERREHTRLETIAASIAAFRDSYNRYPASDDDWSAFESRASDLLDAGENAVEPRYVIRWDALGDPGRIVAMTPDRDFSKAPGFVLPGDKRMLGGSVNRYGSGRFLLMGDGSVLYRGNDWQSRKDFAEWAGWSFKEEPPKE